MPDATTLMQKKKEDDWYDQGYRYMCIRCGTVTTHEEKMCPMCLIGSAFIKKLKAPEGSKK